MKKYVIALAALTVIACTEETYRRTQEPEPVPIVGAAPIVAPTPPNAPQSTQCTPQDLKGHLTFYDAPKAIGVRLINPFDESCGSVYAAIYKINGDGSQNLFQAQEGGLDAKGVFAVALDTPPCSEYQVDVVMGRGAPTTPAFSPGYFIGYKIGKDTNCGGPRPTPRPSPSPTPTPKPSPTPTPCPGVSASHAADFYAVCKDRWKIHVTAHGQFRARNGMNTVFETPVANAGASFTFNSSALSLLLDRRDNSSQDYQLGYESATNSLTPCYCIDNR